MSALCGALSGVFGAEGLPGNEWSLSVGGDGVGRRHRGCGPWMRIDMSSTGGEPQLVRRLLVNDAGLRATNSSTTVRAWTPRIRAAPTASRDGAH